MLKKLINLLIDLNGCACGDAGAECTNNNNCCDGLYCGEDKKCK